MKEIYCTPAEAFRELERRKSDVALKQKVNDYLRGDVPQMFIEAYPAAVLVRHLCTPDCELDVFLEHSRRLNTNPVLLEYVDDKFVAKNKDKHALGKLSFHLNVGNNNRPNTFGMRIIDFNKAEGMTISEIYTLWGERLVDYHHRILASFFPDLGKSLWDHSTWIHRNGPIAKEFYPKFLAQFVCDAILFENFRDHGYEANFLQDTVNPAIAELVLRLGARPLICPLISEEDENNVNWWGYPKERMTQIIRLSRDYRGR